MSDTRENGRDLAEDAAPAHDTARLAETDARADAARELAPEQRIEVSGSANGLEVQHTSAPWYLDERGHIRDPGTDVIIATVVDPDGMIPDDEQMANGRLIERAPLLHAAAARALDYLTDHGIDLDGPEEELVAGIRYDLDEALGNELPRRSGEARAARVAYEPDITAAEPDATERRLLPPDPEGMNENRAAWALAAIRHFEAQTGADRQDALSDLLGDLMHFADRHGFEFGAELDRARDHYQAEISPLPDIEPEREPARPETRLRELEETVAAQIDAAQRVVDSWSNGDLAGAVNGLEEVTEAARATLRDLRPAMPAIEAGINTGRDDDPLPERMTLEAIERDHGKAVTLDLPPDASREMLEDVYAKSERLERMRSDDASVANTPDEAVELARKANQAAARMDEVLLRLDALPAPMLAVPAGGEVFGERMGPAEVMAHGVPVEDMERAQAAPGFSAASERDARIRELERERDRFVIGAPDGTETHDPDDWRRQNRKDAEELDRLQRAAAREPVTVEAIEHDAMSAVRRGLPQDMDARLAARVVETAREVRDRFENAAGHLGNAARELDGINNEVSHYLDVTAERFLEVANDAQLRLQSVQDEYDVADRTRDPGSRILQEARDESAERHRDGFASVRTPHGIDEQDAIAHAREEAARPITLEAIAADPWNAVVRDMPEEAPRELFSAIAEAAGTLYVTPEAEQRRPDWLSGLEPAEIGDMLKSRWQEAAQAADEVRVREAWRAPEFGYDTFAADMWTAVYLPVPQNADSGLLAEARRLAEVCRDLVIEQGPDYGPLSLRVQIDDGPEKFVERAAARMVELDALLPERAAPQREGPQLPFAEGASREPDGAIDATTARDNAAAREAWHTPAFSRESMAADPWTAVYLPIPEHADIGLLRDARAVVRELQLATDSIEHDGPWLEELRQGPAVDRESFTRGANHDAATARRGELSARLEVALAAEIERRPGSALEGRDVIQPEIETRAPRDNGILPADFGANRLFEYGADMILSADFLQDRLVDHAARVMDLVLNVLLIVPEPELTRQQIHDLTRANAERDEQRAVDLAVQTMDADLVAANWTINHNRSPVHGGAGDEVRRSESIYDLYPGLTRHDEGAERAAEAERAFYDTGIERKR